MEFRMSIISSYLKNIPTEKWNIFTTFFCRNIADQQITRIGSRYEVDAINARWVIASCCSKKYGQLTRSYIQHLMLFSAALVISEHQLMITRLALEDGSKSALHHNCQRNCMQTIYQIRYLQRHLLLTLIVCVSIQSLCNTFSASF